MAELFMFYPKLYSFVDRHDRNKVGFHVCIIFERLHLYVLQTNRSAEIDTGQYIKPEENSISCKKRCQHLQGTNQDPESPRTETRSTLHGHPASSTIKKSLNFHYGPWGNFEQSKAAKSDTAKQGFANILR